MQAEKAERVPPGGSGEEAHKDKVLATFLGSSECVASPRLSWELGDGEGGWGQWHSSPLQPVPQFQKKEAASLLPVCLRLQQYRQCDV